MNEITIELRKGIEIVLIDPPMDKIEAYRRAVWFAASWGWDNTFYSASKDYRRIEVYWVKMVIDRFPLSYVVNEQTGAITNIDTGQMWIGQEIRDFDGSPLPYDQVSCFIHEIRHLWQWHTGKHNKMEIDREVFETVERSLYHYPISDHQLSWVAYVIRDHELDAFRIQYAWLQLYRSDSSDAAIRNTSKGFEFLAALGVPGFTPETAAIPGRAKGRRHGP